ncbi:hypothetical protein BGZ94_001390 [Podila epigama]|nr:hypothetical protein BGZ94_001390 [Podila epigama]
MEQDVVRPPVLPPGSDIPGTAGGPAPPQPPFHQQQHQQFQQHPHPQPHQHPSQTWQQPISRPPAPPQFTSQSFQQPYHHPHPQHQEQHQQQQQQPQVPPYGQPGFHPNMQPLPPPQPFPHHHTHQPGTLPPPNMHSMHAQHYPAPMAYPQGEAATAPALPPPPPAPTHRDAYTKELPAALMISMMDAENDYYEPLPVKTSIPLQQKDPLSSEMLADLNTFLKDVESAADQAALGTTISHNDGWQPHVLDEYMSKAAAKPKAIIDDDQPRAGLVRVLAPVHDRDRTRAPVQGHVPYHPDLAQDLTLDGDRGPCPDQDQDPDPGHRPTITTTATKIKAEAETETGVWTEIGVEVVEEEVDTGEVAVGAIAEVGIQESIDAVQVARLHHHSRAHP